MFIIDACISGISILSMTVLFVVLWCLAVNIGMVIAGLIDVTVCWVCELDRRQSALMWQARKAHCQNTATV